MTTLLDAGILNHFGSIFIFIFAFALIFGILEVTSPFGKDKRSIHAILALFVGATLLMSSSASGMLSSIIPWFVVLIVFLFFVMLLFRMFGVDDAQFFKVVKDSNVFIWPIIFSIVILLAGLSAIFGQTLLDKGEGSSATVVTGSQELVIGPDGTMVPVSSSVDYSGTRSTTTSNFSTNFVNTIRNPKVLGLIFILLTGAFMMFFLTRPAGP